MYMLTSASILTSVNSGFSHVMMSYLLFASHTLPYHNALVQAQMARKRSSTGTMLFSCFTINRDLTFLQEAKRIFSQNCFWAKFNQDLAKNRESTTMNIQIFGLKKCFSWFWGDCCAILWFGLWRVQTWVLAQISTWKMVKFCLAWIQSGHRFDHL